MYIYKYRYKLNEFYNAISRRNIFLSKYKHTRISQLFFFSNNGKSTIFIIFLCNFRNFFSFQSHFFFQQNILPNYDSRFDYQTRLTWTVLVLFAFLFHVIFLAHVLDFPLFFFFRFLSHFITLLNTRTNIVEFLYVRRVQIKATWVKKCA